MQFRENRNELINLIGEGFEAIRDWKEGIHILSSVFRMREAVDRIILSSLDKQEPLVMQPVWKTEGKSPKRMFEKF